MSCMDSSLSRHDLAARAYSLARKVNRIQYSRDVLD